MAVDCLEWLTPRVRRLHFILVLLCGCSTTPPPEVVVLWTWSQDDRAEALQAYVDRFNGAQSSIVVRAEAWDDAIVEGRSASKAIDALSRTEGVDEVPSLIEVPEEVLVALIEADLARDLSGHHAERLGVIFDDVHRWLIPGSRIKSTGVAGFPLFHEVPLLVFPEGSPQVGIFQKQGFEAFRRLDEETEREKRTLAAAADFRIFLALLRETKALDVPVGTGEATLELSRARAAGDLIKAIFSEGMLEPGRLGESRALEMFLTGEAESAVLWSNRLGEVTREDIEVVRAPMRTRGTYLVVYANAEWRLRQDAFRVAQWLSEPLQTSELASRFWTAPIRKSAVQSARYRSSPGPAKLRGAVSADDRPLLLPARAAFIEALQSRVEPALVKGTLTVSHFRRLQRTLGTADE